MPLYSLLIKEKAENILSSSKILESTIQLNYALVLITSQSYIVLCIHIISDLIHKDIL